MLDGIGAALILFAATLAGFQFAASYELRPRHIRELTGALQQLESHISFGLTPLPDALALVGTQAPEPVRKLFAYAADEMRLPVSTSDAWKAALERCWPYTAMRAPEREIAVRLGDMLGATDIADQQKHLKLVLIQLQGVEQIAEEERRRYAKMWRSLGMLGGALIVILMM